MPRSNDFFAAMALRRHGRDHIDPGDDNAAEGGALRVRLVRHNEIARFHGAFTRTFTFFVCHLEFHRRHFRFGLFGSLEVFDLLYTGLFAEEGTKELSRVGVQLFGGFVIPCPCDVDSVLRSFERDLEGPGSSDSLSVPDTFLAAPGGRERKPVN